MKPRYNLRTQPAKALLSTANKMKPSMSSSQVTKKSKSRRSNTVINQQNRRHSLRLTSSNTKQTKSRSTIPETIPQWRKAENDNDEENSSINNDNDDDYKDLLARHNRRMLDEQKDRKLYERYIRSQRILRRLQCRRTHIGHLNDATRNRLLRQLERERRCAIQDKISTYLSDHTIVFRHGCSIESKAPMDWSTLEEEIPQNRNIGPIHELDVMINNLKKFVRNSKASISKPRLSVRERQKQRLAAIKPVVPAKSDILKTTEINSSPVISNSMMNPPSYSSLISYSPHVPIVRFIPDQNNKLRTSNSQHLTCIQNVLLHHNNRQSNNNHQNRIVTNEISTPMTIRKSFLRPKLTHVNLSDSSPTKKRPLEKENCSTLTTTPNTVLRATSPMVSIKHTTSSSSSRSYPNTRKHPITNNSLATRRQTRLSTNV